MKKYLLIFVVVFVSMQFFRIDMNNPVINSKHDFIEINTPNDEVKSLLKSACYDCHSNETEYPWYAQIAPVSWWLKHHVDEGREELNFSEWGKYSIEKADHKLEECSEEVKESKMPLNSYTWTHGDAKLSSDQKKLLEEFFEELKIIE